MTDPPLLGLNFYNNLIRKIFRRLLDNLKLKTELYNLKKVVCKEASPPYGEFLNIRLAVVDLSKESLFGCDDKKVKISIRI